MVNIFCLFLSISGTSKYMWKCTLFTLALPEGVNAKYRKVPCLQFFYYNPHQNIFPIVNLRTRVIVKVHVLLESQITPTAWISSFLLQWFSIIKGLLANVFVILSTFPLVYSVDGQFCKTKTNTSIYIWHTVITRNISSFIVPNRIPWGFLCTIPPVNSQKNHLECPPYPSWFQLVSKMWYDLNVIDSRF